MTNKSIRKLMLDKDLTQEDVARLLDVDQATISRLLSKELSTDAKRILRMVIEKGA